MQPYTTLKPLRNVYLEDSWVLDIRVGARSAMFRLDVVLTPQHSEYHAPRPGEHYCYRQGELEFRDVSDVKWTTSYALDATDANGETDFGNIDSYVWLDRQHVLEGEWGEMVVSCGGIVLRLGDEAGRPRGTGGED